MQGSILNKVYQVESQLSKRGSRATFLAKNINTSELVVIKILKFGFDAQWQEFKLFEREAETLKNIDHPAIPNYLDYFELDLPECKGFALVQEYIAAPSLEEIIKTGRKFSELEIKEIAAALLNILVYLHKKQPSIIHRDIKPSNILLTDRSGNSVGQVYLIDFGAVKSVAPVEGGTITVIGTYGYMPPEQFGGHTTPASDLYSLGATLIYLATGRHPTELPNQDGKIAFAKSVQLSNSFVLWVDRAIEPSSGKRFKTATEALQALNKSAIAIYEESEVIKQPLFSKIRLRKSKSKIEVVVPPSGLSGEIIALTFMAIFWNSSLIPLAKVILLTSFPGNIAACLFSIPFFAIGLWTIAIVLFALGGKTRLKIDSRQISLVYECLGIKYQQPKPTPKQKINLIECRGIGWQTNDDIRKSRIQSILVIWANGKPYALNTSVKHRFSTSDRMLEYNPVAELNWLAQEISLWLDIPVTPTKNKHSL